MRSFSEGVRLKQNLLSRIVLVCFVIAVIKYSRPDSFTKKRGLFRLMILKVQDPGAAFDDSLLAGTVSRGSI